MGRTNPVYLSGSAQDYPQQTTRALGPTNETKVSEMTATEANPNDQDMDVMSMLDLIAKSWRVVVTITDVFMLIGALIMMVVAPVYRADIMVQVEDSTDLASQAANGVVGGLASLFDIKSTDDGEMQILNSRLVTQAALDSLHLYIDVGPKRLPLFGNLIIRNFHPQFAPGFLGFGGYAWTNERIDIPRFDVPQDFEDDTFKVTYLGGQRYRLTGGDLDSDAVGQIGTLLNLTSERGEIHLLVNSIDGEPGVAFKLRRRSRQYVWQRLQKDLKVTELGKEQSGVIGVTYDDDDPERASSVLNLIAASYVKQNQQRKIAAADQSLRFLESQLPASEHALSVAEDRLTAYQNTHKVVDLTEQSKSILGQLVDAQTALFQLQQKQHELTTTLSPHHPNVVAVDQQIGTARDTIETYERQLQTLPNNQQGIVRLTRDVRVQTEIYLGLLQSVQQLRLARAGGIGNVRVVDQAIVAELPQYPKAIVVLPISLAAGLIVGMIATIGLSVFAGRVNDPSDIERRMLLDVMASIPISSAQPRLARLVKRGVERPSVLAVRAPHDIAVAALRSLRTAVQFALLERGRGQVVLITGPSPGVGKSFTAANLSVVLGLAEKKVLLIDGDLRRGALHVPFGIDDGPGLSELLLGTATTAAAIVKDVAKNVDLLRGGRPVDEPDELFASVALRDLVASLATPYDVVIIDSPPVLPVTDTAILARAADIILLVVRAGVTTTGEIAETLKRLQSAGSGPGRIIFNGLRHGIRSKQYGYYARYDKQNARQTRIASPHLND
ncbi:MAG: polysaccharide biosynthesis tyrosine autokinase [Candidatus Pacebacteria bacterium]|nr:polysaccharide biosynthesis tyrosine autokinase [Candidatus Paceibacterota bacterium]